MKKKRFIPYSFLPGFIPKSQHSPAPYFEQQYGAANMSARVPAHLCQQSVINNQL